MFVTALVLALVLALLVRALLRTPPAPAPAPPATSPPPPQTPARHVSFSLVASDASLPLSPPPIQRPPSSPFNKRGAPSTHSPRAPQPSAQADQFGRLLPSPSPPPVDVRSPPKSARRHSTPLRLSLTGKRRSPTTSTLIHIDQVDAPLRSPPSSPPLHRAKFVNPFSKSSRSRTLSPPSSKSPVVLSPNPSGMSSPSTSPTGRSILVNKIKSIFKPVSPEPPPIIPSKPLDKSINTRLRRKPVARTQPYGPPWNAPMPVPDLTLSQHPFQESPRTPPPPRKTGQKHSPLESALHERTSMSPGQLSPRTFVNELDEKLTLLQHQRVQDLIPSTHV